MERVRFPGLTFDRQALELVVLFVVVLGATAALAAQIPSETASAVSPSDEFGDGAQGEATAGVAWALAEVAFAAVALAVILLYNRLPEWIQELVQRNGVVAGSMYIGATLTRDGHVGMAIATFVGLITVYTVLDHYGLYWLLNNVLSVGLAIAGGVLVGLVFGVPGMALALVGLTVYDHALANRSGLMFALGKGIVQLRLPVLFLRPDSLRVEWDEVIETMDVDEDEGEASDGSWGLGTADMLLPAGFVAAVITTPSDALLVGGLVAGLACIAGALVACCRLRWEMLTRGSGAGLPALSAGVLVPYAAVVVVATVV